MANRLLAFAKLAHTVAQRTLPERSHRFAPKRYTQPQLLACLLVKEYLALDYRTAQEMLEASDGLRSALGLHRAPDYSTLWHFAHDKATPEVVERALGEAVAMLKTHEAIGPPGEPPGTIRCVALDSTGLWTGHASRYFEWRSNREHRQRSWLKWAVALWTSPQFVVAQRVRPGPCGDFSDLVPLASGAASVLRFDRLVADAGYDSEANHVFCREQLRVESLIPAKKRRSATVVATTRYRSEMVEALGSRALGIAGDPQKRKAYGQRWRVEALMSVVKRKWGEAVTARLEAMQQLQALLRGLVYDLYRLVVLDVKPTT